MIPKFRAWDTFKKKWVKHFYITENGLIYNMEQQHRDLIGAIPIEKSGLIVMQSTGLFDKNGVEIFEADVVTYNSSKSKYIVSFGQFICYFSAYNKRGENILRLAPGCGWYLKHFRDSFWNVSGEVMDEPAKIEVLGNIYENPELVGDEAPEFLKKRGN